MIAEYLLVYNLKISDFSTYGFFETILFIKPIDAHSGLDAAKSAWNGGESVLAVRIRVPTAK